MKKRLLRLIAAVIIFAAALLVSPRNEVIGTVLYIICYIVSGCDVVFGAVRNIIRGQVFDENFLMTIATIGAMVIGEYPEGIAVMIFYQIGELFQSYAVRQSRKSIAGLMDIRPDYANLKKGNEITKADPDDVHVGDVIIIRAGEKIPLDGKVIEGSSMIDTSALTGESLPRDVTVGADILSGCINLNGLLTVEVTKEFGESTVSKILDLVENASSKKAKTENFITKFARIYTPVVVCAALLLAFIPPLFMRDAVFSDWIYRALSFLVISCPCALVVSVPISFFGGIGGASRRGILVKGSNYLEALARTEIVVFDKTGTLTKGVFTVQSVNPVDGISADTLLELAAYAESFSTHPISLSLKSAYGNPIDNTRLSDIEEVSGHGVSALMDGQMVYAGNRKLMQRINIDCPQDEAVGTGTTVHIALNSVYAGYITIADEAKVDSAAAIKQLKQANIKKTVMLTGDVKKAAEKMNASLGLDELHADLLPTDKVDKLEDILKELSGKGKLVFVGDGINDAPVLARADVGIAMGALGSDAAIEAADVVIMTDEPSKIATAINIAKKTVSIASQNIWGSLGIKLIVLILAAAGIATMWAAVFADVGVTVIAVLNSFRALNTKKL